MSWIPEEEKAPSTPASSKPEPSREHVAFIMDGNRRFARKSQVDLIRGHSSGFDKLSETLFWCRDLGIEEVTVYAFSIENFKRPQKEVQELMELAREKFKRLLSETERLKEKGVRVQVLGNLSLLPEDLQKTIGHNKCTLNVAFAYTSREELTSIHPTRRYGPLITKHHPQPQISRKLFLRRRLSEEVRLSDFMLWQSSYAVTYFTQVLWPEFRLTHLMAGIFHYQHNLPRIQALAPLEEELKV
ncbi:Ditrans_polycis-polyprenyl diphosphate synthase ((2E_6E)-farnesyl diphosphate specific) [Caligus rogercresseyi]|uniref:Alkyl transferase n=1 Tax=Caligus rogercresseyi TaxID=217165 RepID=A0A7T8GW41_CALRO|nr:Ditrans_polycis-polyprenyl diphosphate synthase ((2E_6E)-farnesyl diphosphate specific) [Caligus rogercresseyi]